MEDKTAYFGTYNNTLDAYTKQVFTGNYTAGGIKNGETKSKYNTRFRFHKKTEFKNVMFTLKEDGLIDINQNLDHKFKKVLSNF